MAYKTTLKVKKCLIQPNKSSYTTDIKVFMVYKTNIILYLVLSDSRLIRRNMPKTDIILYLVLYAKIYGKSKLNSILLFNQSKLYDLKKFYMLY